MSVRAIVGSGLLDADLSSGEGVIGDIYDRIVPVRVEWVAYGREAAEALRATIAATKGVDPLAPVTVVVPSNHVGVATRRLLASGVLGPVCGRGVGLAAVTFVTPYRRAELLGAPVLAGAGRRPVSTPVIAAALRAARGEDAGVFGPVAGNPATATALVAAYRDVVRLCRAARARLEPDWYDEEDLMAAAADVIAGAPDLGTIVVYLPAPLASRRPSLEGVRSRGSCWHHRRRPGRRRRDHVTAPAIRRNCQSG
ncbi:MAG: hypothetical protein M3083_00805 [Actinomycetota bacterium]|nr:hypothetical protein [Actinomycetota bacterium]MDQ6944784.1 hypothetical protein [Actinomycetota bacterium]